MAYTALARAERLCICRTKTGEPCRLYACWGSVRCYSHGGRNRIRTSANPNKTNYPPCHCTAYTFPHRPGSGGCRWPEKIPAWQDPTPLGTRHNGVQKRRSRRR